MRFAIFGDIHANLEALTAVLADAEKHEVTHYVCLGDVVGYNANPRECLEIVRNLDCPVVKGNHDEQASMEDELVGFNPLAEEAINWTRDQLNAEDKQWLRDLKMVRQVRDFTIVHATLDTPHKWGYVFNQLDAAASFNYQHTQLCFYGHTHAPRAYIRDGSVKSQLLDPRAGQKVFHQQRQRGPAPRRRLARVLRPLLPGQATHRTPPLGVRHLQSAGQNHRGRPPAAPRGTAGAGEISWFPV